MTKIIAMVLSYNRKDLLCDCLAALRAQTRPCDEILVIDNASTDGTYEMLATMSAERLTVYSLPRNVGASGGYNAGMRLAYERDADYIWAMDDDVIPDADALERLLSANDFLVGRSIDAPFVVSTVRAPNGKMTHVPFIDDRRNLATGQNWALLLDRGLAPVTMSTFVSILLPRATLQRYGLPIAAMFIWGEDSEFTLRVTRKQPGYLVGDSRVLHIRAIDGPLDIATENSAARVKYHFYHKRNDIYLKRRYDGPRAIVRQIRKQIIQTLRLCKGGHFAKAGIVAKGTAQGIRFNPRIEAASDPFDRTGVRMLTFAEPSDLRARQQVEAG